MSNSLSRVERQQRARQISGLLFAAEVESQPPNHARLLLMRLRADAHLRAETDGKSARKSDQVWEHYGQLLAGAIPLEFPP